MVETEPCDEGHQRQVFDSLNPLFAHVNKIGVSQQKIKAQVPARDFSVAVVRPEAVACMVFNMPLRDNDTADVVWDEEIQHMFDQHG
jgi:hypothetical protein